MDHLIRDHMRRQMLWAKPPPAVEVAAHKLDHDIETLVATEFSAPPEAMAPPQENKKVEMAANTGAKGFAAFLKTKAAAMRAEFEKLSLDIEGEFHAMETHIANGKAALADIKSENAELREALGMDNGGPKS